MELMKKVLIILLITFSISVGYAQNPVLSPTGKGQLNVNNINAQITNSGMIWSYDSYGNRTYFQENELDTAGTLMSGAIWAGGLENDSILHISVDFYGDNPGFFPGPLRLDGTTTSDLSIPYDRVWNLKKWEVRLFREWYIGNIEYYEIPETILTYPGNGNVASGFANQLAPFHDENGDGIYDPLTGDYPEFDLDNVLSCEAPKLHGDQCIYWIMNDVGDNNISTGAPLGIELHCQAYAFIGSQSVSNTTFYTFDIINRSNINYTEFYLGKWLDTDIGCSEDDYAECDVPRGLAFSFNADSNDNDGCNGAIGYDYNPPAFGLDFVKGPLSILDGLDNDFDNTIDESDERMSMSRFLYRNTSGTGWGSPYPSIDTDFYYFMSGRFKDGTELVYGGTGHISDPTATAVVTTHSFPGASDSLNWFSTGGIDPGYSVWDEISEANPKGDRRLIGSIGPFDLNAGDTLKSTSALIWSRDIAGGHLGSKAKIRLTSDTIQTFTDNCFDEGCIPPVADFEWTNENGNYIFAPLLSNVTCSWDFGDGGSSSSVFGQHEFLEEDFVTVCLTATNSCGSSSKCLSIYIKIKSPNTVSFPVQRIEGKGNDGWSLEIEDSCFLQLANGSNFIHNPTYKGGHSPISIEMINNDNVTPGTYVFKMNHSDIGAGWWMYRIGGTDTILSDVAFGTYARQLIPQWGIAVRLNSYQYSNPYSSVVYTEPISFDVEYDDPSKKWLNFIEDVDGSHSQNWIRSGTVRSNCDFSTFPEFTDDPCRFLDYIGIDNEESYEDVLEGKFSPYRLVSKRTQNSIAGVDFQSSISSKDLDFLQSIDIVLTSNQSLWSRCPVIENQNDETRAMGGVKKQYARSGNSVDKNGLQDGSGTGMSWFPGYAVNVETGERLNIAFGEDSDTPANNGTDMIWNPTSYISAGSYESVVWGGKHMIYVFGNEQDYPGMPSQNGNYDEGAHAQSDFINGSASDRHRFWRSCMWVGMPVLQHGHSLLETDARIKIRVKKPLEDFGFTLSDTINGTHPLYHVFIDTLDYCAEQTWNSLASTVYPNPSNVEATIQFQNEVLEEMTLYVVDMNGKIVDQQASNCIQFKVNTSRLEAGVYIYYLKNPDGSKIDTGRIVVTNP
jgi:hypothetical protein